MNLFNLAQSGLSAAQNALNVVGNNLTNATTSGYSRQNIILGEAGGKSTNYGFFGYGVKTGDVQRAYDGFISNQVRGAATQYMSLTGRYEQVSQIDNMLGDSTNNISTSMDGLFEAMEAVSKDPVDPAARQGVLAQFNAIANQYRSNSSTLNGLEKSTNTQIDQTVTDINACTKQLAELNQQIEKIHGQTGGMPSDLLDQRDQLLNQLSQNIGIKVSENKETGTVDVSMGNGMALVSGGKSYQLQASTSAENPAQTVVSYVDASGNALALDENATSGKLGGLFKFRNEDLVSARDQLNQLALQMANKFNEVNGNGYDLNGNAGGDIFSIGNPQAVGNTDNAGSGSLDVSFTDITAVKSQDYQLVYNGPGSTDWTVTTRDGRAITPTIGGNGELEFEGISIMPGGTPQPGDSFTLNPTDGAADRIAVAITDGDEIAASSSADPTEESNNENILALIGIKDEEVVGKMTLSGAYASLVSSVGSSVSALKGDITTSAKVYDQWSLQQQSVSGVDMNEEYVNMQMFSQYYQANAQVLQTATTIFDTILSIR
ncbi:UNVERIFIED_ORG: flagellar hook-associated protein 1 FlgK [Kosakonia oryzae]|uniref:Flagellar hook-associated protein 1 n=1 Tax=Kosakonia radicincitans TaxID=283686 RepID=A0AAX2EQQ1_9ENTR|nr:MULTISPECIES: flagellar hook-associated protein FlgK [Kosakonia]MDP9566086.1 flagellar hook-associated protein 1 FlgK [Kosakonia oryzae]APG19380.1 flagellar biosynthesis protein FlgK [Kosakonia radicincitans]NCF08074.1 flagellar hook-associated protein FlgK [Kosakonia sp. MH5]SFE16302.1 flagellar hook-associated protein 1 FlgK [Kosakonia radicincitans]SFR08164.1 flagellar hook-associated protein 1 FlgK [Kosakonia radicincitans]